MAEILLRWVPDDQKLYDIRGHRIWSGIEVLVEYADGSWNEPRLPGCSCPLDQPLDDAILDVTPMSPSECCSMAKTGHAAQYIERLRERARVFGLRYESL